MSIFTDITNGLAAADSALSSVGHASFASLGSALDKALEDVRSAAVTSTEQVILDALETAFPQLKLFIAVADAVKAIPGFKPADVGSPVRRATDDSPYAGTDPVTANQGE